MQFPLTAERIIRLFFLSCVLVLLGSRVELIAQIGFQNPDIDFTVSDLALQSDGKIVVGGGFSTVAGQARSRVARLNANGSLDTSFQNPNLSRSGSSFGVSSVAVQTDGKVIVAGNFDNVGGESHPNLARLNTNGSVDSSFNAIVGGVVYTVLLQLDGKIIIGGSFTSVNGLARNRLARLNADGSLDVSFVDPAVDNSMNPGVGTLAIQPDGKLLIGGNFSSVGGQTRSGAARLNIDGTIDISFGLSVNASVSQFVVLPSGKILICGFASLVNGIPRRAVARIFPDGSLDTSFQDLVIPSGNVTQLGLQNDGKIIVGGFFSSINGQSRMDLARLDADGNFDPSFQEVNPNFGGSFASLNKVLIQPDGKILVGGYFTEIGGQPRRMVVRLNSDGILDLPPAQTFTVTKTLDTNDGTCDSDCSLREAIAAANVVESGLIRLDTQLFSSPQTITLTAGELFVSDNRRIAINGSGATLVTISGNYASRILRLNRDAKVTINGVTLTNGNGNGTDVFNQGGAIYVSPNGINTQLTLNSVIVSNNSAGTGGGIRSSGNCVVNINNSTISGNVATGNLGGGGIYSEFGTLNVAGSTIVNNASSFSLGGSGGIAISGAASIFNLTNSSVIANSGAFTGGIGAGGTTTITNSNISNNRATKSAGGLGASGNVTVTDSVISGNSVSDANGSGGGVNNTGRLTMTNSVINNNSAIVGGGIFTSGGLSLTSSTVRNNTSTEGGAGIYNNVGGSTNLPVTIQDSEISGNVASGFGGGIYNRDLMTLDRSTVSNNSSLLVGGGVFNVLFNVGIGSPIFSATNSTFSSNNATQIGGGISNQAGSINLTNTTVSGNIADAVGGINTISGGTVNLVNVTLAFNTGRITAIAGFNNGGSTVNSRNTIFAKNTALGSTSGSDFTGNLNSQGFNLLSSSAGAVIGGNTTGNLVEVDPLLKELTNNGGRTKTHGLASNSPAIDAAGQVNGLLMDQRASGRPYDFQSIPNANGGNGSDIGAYEAQQTDLNRYIAPHDFDGDGKTDISIFRPSVGEWYYQRSSNSVVNGAQFGSSTDKPAPADYTGDGKTDIAFFRPSTGEWFIIRSEDSSYFAFPFGVSGDIPTPGDFDGDGKADQAVFRPSNGVWYINKSGGGVGITSFGTNGDRPVVADYDGDGKADIAIFRPSVGEWYYIRSTDSQVRGNQFGSSTDKPVQGDYTGDGKSDFAFFRPSTGSWFVLRSEDSSFFASPFGTSTDIPTPSDYDGDGKFDQAVFRPSNGVWYLNRSTAGIQIQQFGTATDLPVPSYYLQ
jgi:uncharacterized delta-60 repeat protein/CSLREA domain-containing protein